MILDAQSRNNLTCMSQCSGNGCHVGSIQTPGYRLGYHTVVMVTGIITFFFHFNIALPVWLFIFDGATHDDLTVILAVCIYI